MSTQTETFFITLLLAISFLAAGCLPVREVSAGMEDSGKQIELSQGQTLVVRLDANMTTGYGWEVIEGLGPVLQQAGEAEYKQDETGAAPRVGAGGTQIFRFKAAAAGQAALKLVYRRPWEKDTAPAREYTLRVVVR